MIKERRVLISFAAILFVMAVLFTGVFLVAHSAHAGVGTGGTSTGGGANCTGGGINGCPWTTNGHGWFQVAVDSANAPNGNGYWANANATCKGEGATHVIAYVVRTGEKTLNKAWIYKFPWAWAGYSPYVGNISVGSAQAMFDKVADKKGFTFGVDVGWFCYNANPPWSISVSSTANADVAYPGETITWTHKVTNLGDGTTNKTVTWYYQNTGDLGTGKGANWTFSSGQTRGASNTNTSTYVVKLSDFGKEICRATRATPKSHKENEPIQSAADCVTIGKKPKVQIYGGDLRAIGTGGAVNVTTSMSSANGSTYGSWSEYGIMASGRVRGMASGSGFAGGASTSNLCASLSLLTLTNANNSVSPSCDLTQLGGYQTTTVSPADAIIARFAPSQGAQTLTGAVNLQSLASKTVYPGAGTITLSATGSIPKGKWVVINAPSATVRIAQNIRYTTDTLSSVNELPQVVILAKNIIIADSVTNVDAWLIAKGQSAGEGFLNTCDAPGVSEPTQLSSKVCDKKLTVNGPVMVNRLLLYRTGGSGSTIATFGAPAEEFNLRPDAYMWAGAHMANVRAQTVTTIDLPPRF